MPAMACVFCEVEPEAHWIFYTGYDAVDKWQNNLNDKFREENITFWHEYVGKSVSRESVEEALYNVNLLSENTSNEFYRCLMDKHDTVALQYWMCLKITDPDRYEEERWVRSAWYYPEVRGPYWWDDEYSSSERMDMSIIKVEKLDEDCIASCPNGNIRNRYVLQMLRKCFYAADYDGCIRVWTEYGDSVPQSVLRSQCLNYYAGALLRSQKTVEAAVVYAGIGYGDVYLNYDPYVLREIYCQYPDCDEFEFMVQQFVNKYFDEPVKSKGNAFIALADEIINDGKNSNPALWKSAQAAIAYINNNTHQALLLLSQAEKMRGTDIVKENIRMMRLLFNSTRTDNDNQYEATLYPDLKWLTENIKNDMAMRDTIGGNYDMFCDNDWESLYYSNLPRHRQKILRRVIFLGMVPHFERVNMNYKGIAYLNMYDEVTYYDKRVREFGRQGQITVDTIGKYYGMYRHPAIYRGTYSEIDCYTEETFPYRELYKEISSKHYDCFTYKLNFDYEGNLFHSLDTTEMDEVLRYVDFLCSVGKTAMDRYLVNNSYCDLNYFYDIIGTRYMRQGKYDLALAYLHKVAPDFKNRQNITEYICKERNPFAERWITKKSEHGKYNLSFDPVAKYDSLPGKIEFCNIMQQLQRSCYSAKTEEERAMSAYAYAVGLYQSVIGCAWPLTDYYRSYSDISSYLDENPEYLGEEEEVCQIIVDKYLDMAMKYKGDRVFTMKCMIMHSKYRMGLRTEYDYYMAFKPEIRETLCDVFVDYAAK